MHRNTTKFGEVVVANSSCLHLDLDLCSSFSFDVHIHLHVILHYKACAIQFYLKYMYEGVMGA